MTITEQEVFDCSVAINLVKKGYKLTRKAWGSKNIFIYLVKPQIINTSNLRNEALDHSKFEDVREDSPITISAHIDMRTASGSIVVGWAFTTNDAMAEDWMIAE